MKSAGGPARLARSLHANLGIPGLLLGLFSILSFIFGLVVLIRESDRLRQTGRDALRPIVAGWVRTLPLDYLGSTLADYVDRWKQARTEERAARLTQMRAALAHLGELFDRVEMRRTRLIDLVSLDLGPPEEEEGPPLATWRPRLPRRASPLDRTDRVPVLELSPHEPPLVELVFRYRIAPEIEAAAAEFEARYRRLALALLGLSLFPLLCLLYMVLQASSLRRRAAKEAAQEATIDLADRTCHELGNIAFVLANERRNLSDHLALVDQYLTEEPALLARALDRAGIDAEHRERFLSLLERFRAEQGLDPEVELRGSTTIARDVCRQIAVCSSYIALTVRELDSYLKQTSLPLQIAPLAVSSCLDDATALLGPRLEAAGVRVDRDQEEPGLEVLADRRLLVHALVNLLKNAVEAASGTRAPSTVHIRSRVVGSRVEIEVSDDGPGIAPDVLPHLFEDGFTTKGPGRGRGLAIVHESILAQYGQIEVESQPGHGTTFLLTLPLAPAPTPDRAGALVKT